MMATSYRFAMRFCPTEEELITYYLERMVKNQPLPSGWEKVMIVRDIYGESQSATPWILFRDDPQWQTTLVDPLGKILVNQKAIYVFTRLSKVGKTGDKNKNRRAGCGQWHGNSAQEPIKKNKGMGDLIGYKKTFTFRSSEETLGQWTMQEYELAGASLVGLNRSDYENNNFVLCKIKTDDSKSSKGGRLVSKKNSTSYPEEVQYSNYPTNGVEAMVQSLRSCDGNQEISSHNYATDLMIHGEQTDSGVQSGSLMEAQSIYYGDETHRPITNLNEEAKDNFASESHVVVAEAVGSDYSRSIAPNGDGYSVEATSNVAGSIGNITVDSVANADIHPLSVEDYHPNVCFDISELLTLIG
ncbi:hypothetical protein ACH5RR_032925 [Cinchona calisaya]|uniref:NAC domain-containing protein n=1 Tax=Cinchona calisaya TaxID=153742 RepID=A0ABD2YPU0_9GENT